MNDTVKKSVRKRCRNVFARKYSSIGRRKKDAGTQPVLGTQSVLSRYSAGDPALVSRGARTRDSLRRKQVSFDSEIPLRGQTLLHRIGSPHLAAGSAGSTHPLKTPRRLNCNPDDFSCRLPGSASSCCSRRPEEVSPPPRASRRHLRPRRLQPRRRP